MKMHLRVNYDDGSTADAVVSAVDLVSFESKFNKSVARFQDDMMMTDIYWLAWHALNRMDRSIGDFEQWLTDKNPDVEFGESKENEIVPLESNPPHGS